jgi:pyruvate/2-oxoglutarate dehydrogenase complex dihydrolipoamide acyltransferase (E2) component
MEATAQAIVPAEDDLTLLTAETATAEEHQAAAKLQSKFRGFKLRKQKSMMTPDSSSSTEMTPSSEAQQPPALPPSEQIPPPFPEASNIDAATTQAASSPPSDSDSTILSPVAPSAPRPTDLQSPSIRRVAFTSKCVIQDLFHFIQLALCFFAKSLNFESS